MRLPQDRILHIDIDFENGKVIVVTEWQGELVRCKDCKWREEEYCGFLRFFDGGGMIVKDDGFCSYGERKE